MIKNPRSPAVYLLGRGVLVEKLQQRLSKKSLIYREVRPGKKADYVFLVGRLGEFDGVEIINLLKTKKTKILFLCPRAQVIELTTRFGDNPDFNIRIVGGSPGIFNFSPSSLKSEQTSSYLDYCLRDILGAMFGEYPRGGLFFLPEPPFLESGSSKEKQKTTFLSPPKWPNPKNILLVFLLSIFLPLILTITALLIGLLSLLLFWENPLFFTRVAEKSFNLAQQTNKLVIIELGLIKKEKIGQDLGRVIAALHDLSAGAYHLTKGLTPLKSSFVNFISGQTQIKDEDLRIVRGELVLAQERVVKAELELPKPKTTLLFFDKQVSSLKEDIGRYKILLGKTILFLEVFSQILGSEVKKTYLVLLQNNMELRPTGGFIGSYGLLTFEDGRFLGFEVSDVYWADGQLRGHVEPPLPIREHLEQPHWFLRDSNWDPDFEVSGRKAAWFLEKEVGQKVNGVIGIDLSLIEAILEAIGGVNLPDYQEIITKDNLFERAHFYAQEDFFPGSRSKANFLESLARMIFDKLQNEKKISWFPLLESLIKKMEEKHLMFVFNDPELQKLFSLNNLTGSLPLIKDQEENRLQDFFMVVDANLGVNKVNFFVERNIFASITLNEDGLVSEVLKITYQNLSPKETYKNYLRVITSKGTIIKKVEFGGEEIKKIDREKNEGKSITGFLITVPPQQEKLVKVVYELEKKMPVGKGLNSYNLLVLKQPGTINDSLRVVVNYPVYQSQSFLTDLSRDRNFKIEFLREKD